MRTIISAFMLLMTGTIALSQPCINNTHSLNFSAASVNFTTDTNLAPDSAITVEAWIKASSWAAATFEGSIVCKHSWSQGEQGYVLRAGNNGQLNFSVCGKNASGASISWINASSPVGAMLVNTWYHVAGTYDGDSIRVFINGIQRGATSLPDGMIRGLAYPIRIGRLSDQSQSQTRYFSGQIDEVRIWERALTASEILARYNTHLDPTQETGLVGYWRFNNGTGATVTDETTNGNNGTTSGANWNTNVPFNQTAVTPIIFPNAFLLTCLQTYSSYQWNLNNNPINGANGPSWTAVANGAYTVTVTDSLGCTATSGAYVIAGVGLAEIPANDIEFINQADQIIIRMKNGELIQSIEVYNMNLQKVDEAINPGTSVTRSKDNLQPGIYKVVIRTAHQKSTSFSFVKL